MPTYDAFISYSRYDIEFVKQLVDRLMHAGLSVFFDQANIAVGEPLVDSLAKAIADSKYVLIVMSPAYFESNWSTPEWQMAMAEESSDRRTKLIPLLYQDCEVPPILSMKVFADVRTPEAFERSFPQLLEILGEQPGLHQEPRAETNREAIGSIPQAGAGVRPTQRYDWRAAG